MIDQTLSESINRMIQKHQAAFSVREQTVSVDVDAHVTFIVDGIVYQDLIEIEDVAVRQLFQTAIDDCQTGLLLLPERVADKRRQRFYITLTALSPLILGLLLFRINPSYMGELFVREAPYAVAPYLPCGWVIVAVTFILVTFARIGYWLIDGKLQLGHLQAFVKTIVVVLFFVIVAIANLVFLLGPAAFQILRNDALR